MIGIHLLNRDEVQLVRLCLQAAARGPFFPDWEFETLFGLSRGEVRTIAEGWPQNAGEASTEVAVMNALVNLIAYPHGQEVEVRSAVASDPQSLRRLLDKLRSEDQQLG